MMRTAAEDSDVIDFEQERAAFLINERVLHDPCAAEGDLLCLRVQSGAVLDVKRTSVTTLIH